MPAPLSLDPIRRTIPGIAPLLLIGGWLALDQLLLWRFLGFGGWPALLIGAAALIAIGWMIARSGAALPRIPLNRVALLFAFALLLCALGGQGKLFYANIDWQVREAVLRDLALHPWPFAYLAPSGAAEMLRAPIGMFLIPAQLWKVAGPVAGHGALLLQNALLLTALLSLGSLLFDTRRARLIALAAATLFSGLDIVGQALFHSPLEDHLEFTFDWLQYSSHLTQTFWVPQHAIAGWSAAILFLLWRTDRLPLRAMLAVLPLTALWSPLALLGAMPFLALAGIETLTARKLTRADVLWPTLASLIAIPGLAYLASAGDGVGVRLRMLPLDSWGIVVALELLVWSVPLLLIARTSAFGRAPLILASLILPLLPFVQVGTSLDFLMRASIVPLALTAAYAAEALGSTETSRPVKNWLWAMLAIGSVTGASELRRALFEPASSMVACSLYGAWQPNFAATPMTSYIAPVDRLPGWLRTTPPTLVPVNDPPVCWQGRWIRPSGV
jgi:hypothetical protein